MPNTNIQYQTDPGARYFIYVVLQEVGYAIKKHKSSLFDDLSEEACENQEQEAGDLAMKWFNEHVERLNNLPPITNRRNHFSSRRATESHAKNDGWHITSR